MIALFYERILGIPCKIDLDVVMSESLAKSKFHAALLSLIAALLVLALKFAAYYQTRSLAILSDALETIVNVITALIAVFVVRIGSEPADENHPYGHGKAEYFSAAFEGGLVVSAGLYIIYEAIQGLFRPPAVQDLTLGAIWIGAATFINLLVGIYLKRIGKKHNSVSLTANGTHVLSDVKTTVGVMIGLLIGHLSGLDWMDSALALFVGAHLLYEGFQIVRESISVLTDEIDEQAIQKLSQSFEKNRNDGIIDIHKVKMIRSGPFHHVDAHLVLPEYWDVSQAHEASEKFERSVVRDYEFDGEIAFHVDPCQRKYCSQCAVRDCPIRQEAFVQFKKFEVKTLIATPML